MRVPGVTIATATIGALVDAYGGTLDAGIPREFLIHRLGPSDRYGDYALAPVLHERGAIGLVHPDAWLLVAQAVAGRAPAGRRWIHPRAELVLAQLLTLETNEPEPFVEAPVHPSAHVTSAIVEPGARIGRDVVIGPGSRVETGAIVHPGVVLGARVIIGAGSIVGRRGFGYVDRPGTSPIRLPHRAGVVLGDDVEIGALCTIDAGILAPTSIDARTKLDAQVHVGHGVRLGQDVRVAAQVGFAGSVVVEDDVRIGGQAGIADHVCIGKGARIAAKAGVIGDVPAGAVFAGYPAVARGRWLRGYARLYRA